MSLQRIVGVALLVAGVLLVVLGLSATQKMDEKIIGEITGTYSHTTMWYIIGGSVLIVIGAGMAWVRKWPF